MRPTSMYLFTTSFNRRTEHHHHTPVVSRLFLMLVLIYEVYFFVFVPLPSFVVVQKVQVRNSSMVRRTSYGAYLRAYPRGSGRIYHSILVWNYVCRIVLLKLYYSCSCHTHECVLFFQSISFFGTNSTAALCHIIPHIHNILCFLVS